MQRTMKVTISFHYANIRKTQSQNLVSKYKAPFYIYSFLFPAVVYISIISKHHIFIFKRLMRERNYGPEPKLNVALSGRRINEKNI